MRGVGSPSCLYHEKKPTEGSVGMAKKGVLVLGANFAGPDGSMNGVPILLLCLDLPRWDRPRKRTGESPTL